MTSSLVAALLFAFLPANGAAPSSPADSSIALTVQEPSGIAREAEPVTSGVPLPKGWAERVDELALKKGGAGVPAEVRVASRWPDGSLRWVHLDFQASVEAGGEVALTLEKGRAPAVASQLAVQEDEDGLTVSTGALEADISRADFNVINQLWLSEEDSARGEQLVAPHDRGLLLWKDGVEYSAARAPATLKVESRGPMRVVLRAEGALADDAGAPLFHYICRLYFYNNSPVVRVAYTVENRNPAIDEKVEVEGLHVEVPTTVGSQPASFYIGRPGGDVEGTLEEKTSGAFVLASSSTEYVFGGAAQDTEGGLGKAKKSDRLGWIGLAGEKGGVALGLRHFWQMYPSSLEVSAENGLLRAGLIPHELGGAVDMYSGMARTHYLRFAFLGANDPARMRSLAAAAQKPLRAFSTPAHYSASRAFGRIRERDLERYPREHRPIVRQVDNRLDEGLAHMLEKVDRRTVNGVTVESYGFLNWGDGMHYVWTPHVNRPGNVAWNHHYYDLPHMSCLEFARTGNRAYYDYCISRAYHLMDLHVVHFGPESELAGHNRYDPSTDHARLDPETGWDFRTAKLYVHPNQNHSKTQGLFDRYSFTGDERSRDVALEALAFANALGSYEHFEQPRGAGHQVITLVEGYQFTGDRRYLETARSTFETWWAFFQERDSTLFSRLESREDAPSNRFFQIGFLLEGFIDYYRETGDERVTPLVQQAVEWMRTHRPGEQWQYPNLALALGFLATELDDPQYTQLQKDYLENWEGIYGNPFKDYAMYGRSLPRALYYLSKEGLQKK